jgi:hypothetical protein
LAFIIGLMAANTMAGGIVANNTVSALTSILRNSPRSMVFGRVENVSSGSKKMKRIKSRPHKTQLDTYPNGSANKKRARKVSSQTQGSINLKISTIKWQK